MAEIDKDASGEIDRAEFIEWWKKTKEAGGGALVDKVEVIVGEAIDTVREWGTDPSAKGGGGGGRGRANRLPFFEAAPRSHADLREQQRRELATEKAVALRKLNLTRYILLIYKDPLCEFLK